jgi:hypothetical protein
MARRAERGVPGQRAGLATMRESGVIKRREIHPETGPKLESTAQPRDAGDGIQLQVPHPWHLIAMKLWPQEELRTGWCLRLAGHFRFAADVQHRPE